MENEKPKLTKEKLAEIQKKFFTIYKKGKYVFRHNNPNFYFNKWKFLSNTPVKIRQRKDRKIKLSVLLYYSTISSEYVNPFEHLNLDSKRMSKDLFDKYNRYILLHNIGSIGGKKKKSVEDFKKYATKDIQDSYNKEKALKKLFDKIDENNKILVKKSFDEMKKNKNFNDDDNNVVNNDNNVYENKNKENKIENVNVDVNEKKIDDDDNKNLRNKNVKENKKPFEIENTNFIKTKTNDENSDQNKIPFNDNNNKNLDKNKIEIPTDEFNEIELKKKISLEKPDLNKKEIDEEENYDFDKNKKEIKTSFDNNEKNKIIIIKKQKPENEYKYKRYCFSDEKKILPSRKDSEIDENKIELFNDLSDGKPTKIEEKDDFDENNDIDENKKELFNDLSDLPPKPFEPVDYNFNFDYFPSYYDYDNNEIKNENEIPEKKEKLRSVIKRDYSKKQTENDEENNLNEIDENKKQIDEEENYDIDLNKKEILDNEGAKKKKINYDDYYRNLYNWHYYYHLHNYYHNLYHQHYYYHNYYNNLRKNAKEENPLNPSNKLIDNNENVNNINSGIINKPVLIEDKNKKDDDKNLKIERENSTVPVVAKKHETHVNKIVENDNNINVKGIINNPIIEESKENIIINKTELELPKEIDKEKQYKGWLFLKILSFVSYEKNNRFAKGFFDTWKENAEIKKKNFEDNRIETKFNH